MPKKFIRFFGCIQTEIIFLKNKHQELIKKFANQNDDTLCNLHLNLDTS